MLIEFDGKRPCVAESAYVAPNAVLRGDVRIGPGTAVLFGVVVTGDGGPVEIGADCVIMENAVLRGAPKHPLRIGDCVLVGPNAHLSGCVVNDGCFVATGAALFNGAYLEKAVEVRINGVVHVNTRLEEGAVVPIGWVAVGSPAHIRPPSDHEAIWHVQRELDFSRTVWGVDSARSHAERTKRYAKALLRHKRDTIIDE